jgi:uncharacterized membrane protein YfcA
MSAGQAAVLFGAAVLGGAINAVAGGGGFICFPTLLFAGVPAIPANATNTVSLLPGTLTSLVAYRERFKREDRWLFLPLVSSSIVGGVGGAMLLLHTPPRTFLKLIPWLLLGATVLFILSGRITRFVHRAISHRQHSAHRGARRAGVVAAVQLAVSIYIGYFGAGAGILILAMLAIVGLEDIHSMNAFKQIVATCSNGIAVITFIIVGAVYWHEAVVMIVGAALGGYAAAWYAQKVQPDRVRYVVIAIGLSMSAYFFIHGARA